MKINNASQWQDSYETEANGTIYYYGRTWDGDELSISYDTTGNNDWVNEMFTLDQWEEMYARLQELTS